jgi:DNA-binding beta-propeller fold protein YncE
MRRLAIACCLSLAALAAAAPAAGDFGYLTEWGEPGSGPGQFGHVLGVAADPAGNVFVADEINSRVQKFTPDGALLAAWGSEGSGNGQFFKLADVAAGPDGSIYTLEGSFSSDWALRGNDRVQKFDPSGNFLLEWGGQGPADGQFQNPRAIAVDPSGNVYVADSGGNRIEKFDPNGSFLLKWGSGGLGPGQFRFAGGVATDSSGKVYVLDALTRRIQKFDGNGTYISEFTVPEGDRPDCLLALDVDVAGFVYVAAGCTGIDHLRRFAPDGTLAKDLGPCNGGFLGIAAHPSGKVFASFEGNATKRLLVFGDGGGVCPGPPPGPGGGPGGGPAPVGPGLSFDGTEGVTVDAGAQFTNSPLVELTIKAPGGVTQVLLSNDGGFLAPVSRPPDPSGRYSWTLATSGSERLPKTVYVRFTGPGGQSALTFSDDIILDQTAPQVSQASLSGGGSVSVVRAARKQKYTLRVRASDNASGVKELQLAANKRRAARPRKFASRLTFRAATPPKFVRVRDGAGNFSKWRRVKR